MIRKCQQPMLLQQRQGRSLCGHSNRVSAKIPERWLLEGMKGLLDVDGLVERAVEMARSKCAEDLGPQQEALEINRQALKENQTKIDRLIESITSGEVAGPFLAMLNSKAAELQREQEHLKAEQRGLQQALTPLHSHFDAEVLRDTLQQFGALCEAAQPQEMQQLVRTLVHRIEWQPEGESHAIELYALPKTKNQPSSFDKDWLETMCGLPGRSVSV